MRKINTLTLASLALLLTTPLFATDLHLTLAKFDTWQNILLLISFVTISIGMLSSGYMLSISLSAYAACEKTARGAAFVPAVMPGSQGLYSFAIAFMMLENLGTKPMQVALAGIICGLPCLYSAYGQAKTAAACIKSISNGHMDLGQALLATGVPELYALTGLAAAFLVMQ